MEVRTGENLALPSPQSLQLWGITTTSNLYWKLIYGKQICSQLHQVLMILNFQVLILNAKPALSFLHGLVSLFHDDYLLCIVLLHLLIVPAKCFDYYFLPSIVLVLKIQDNNINHYFAVIPNQKITNVIRYCNKKMKYTKYISSCLGLILSQLYGIGIGIIKYIMGRIVGPLFKKSVHVRRAVSL